MTVRSAPDNQYQIEDLATLDPVNEVVERTADGALIYDPSLIPNASPKTFSAAGWKTVRRVDGVLNSGGRGNTLIIGDGEREFVLRHFRRGGLPGRFVKDAYLWLGEDKTRPFAEWRMLSKLCQVGLPVPKPAIARYQRRGPFYVADIITLKIPDIRSLTERLLEATTDADFWRSVGQSISRFHEAGVNHADLNSHNVQIDSTGTMWLLDFDKAKLAPAGTWRQKNLSRLHRSLQKIKRKDNRVNYSERDWKDFLEGYFHASRSA